MVTLIKISTLEDVKLFTRQLVAEGTNVHPDEDFCNYIKAETGADTYNQEEAALRNKLMNESFQVCEESDEDIYNVMQEIFLIESGLDKYIPLPPQKFDAET